MQQIETDAERSTNSQALLEKESFEHRALNGISPLISTHENSGNTMQEEKERV